MRRLVGMTAKIDRGILETSRSKIYQIPRRPLRTPQQADCPVAHCESSIENGLFSFLLICYHIRWHDPEQFVATEFWTLCGHRKRDRGIADAASWTRR